MNAGELNKRISVVTLSTVTNDNGFDVLIETEYCKCWAKISNVSGTEIFKSGADYSKTTTRFVVRYRKFDTTMKIRYGENLYNIVYVNNYNEDNIYVEIVGEVVLNG